MPNYYSDPNFEWLRKLFYPNKKKDIKEVLGTKDLKRINYLGQVKDFSETESLMQFLRDTYNLGYIEPSFMPIYSSPDLENFVLGQFKPEGVEDYGPTGVTLDPYEIDKYDYPLNKALVHEIVHSSGVHNEDKTQYLTDLFFREKWKKYRKKYKKK